MASQCVSAQSQSLVDECISVQLLYIYFIQINEKKEAVRARGKMQSLVVAKEHSLSPKLAAGLLPWCTHVCVEFLTVCVLETREIVRVQRLKKGAAIWQLQQWPGNCQVFFIS